MLCFLWLEDPVSSQGSEGNFSGAYGDADQRNGDEHSDDSSDVASREHTENHDKLMQSQAMANAHGIDHGDIDDMNHHKDKENEPGVDRSGEDGDKNANAPSDEGSNHRNSVGDPCKHSDKNGIGKPCNGERNAEQQSVDRAVPKLAAHKGYNLAVDVV